MTTIDEELRVIAPAEALSAMLDVEYLECRDGISFEYVGDLTYVITAPRQVDADELTRLARDILPVAFRVEVRHP
jgi:hypothetical protein